MNRRNVKDGKLYRVLAVNNVTGNRPTPAIRVFCSETEVMWA
jgi:hypothetical protein